MGSYSLANTLDTSEITTGKVITCKAAVVWGPGKPFVMDEIQVDPPQKMEVRVKILFTSVCHTDISAWKGENEMQRKYPRILGHEAAGIVESVGEGVEDLAQGDRVIPIFNGECLSCGNCKSEKTNLCEKFRVNPFKSVMSGDGKTRFRSKDGEPIYHFLNTSTFSHYTVLDSACVLKIDPVANFKTMTLLSCGLATGVGAVWNTANVQAGSTVAIFGLGAVGLAVAEGARLRKASKIIGIDINPEKFEKGKGMGLTDFIDSRNCEKPIHEVIREICEGGVDYSFECVGNMEVLREAFLSTHDGWGLTVILGIHNTPELLRIHPMELFDGRKLVGCIFGDFKGKTQLPDLADKCLKGVTRFFTSLLVNVMGEAYRLGLIIIYKYIYGVNLRYKTVDLLAFSQEVNMDAFITHELPFSKINEAFDLLTSGKSLRCLLHL